MEIDWDSQQGAKHHRFFNMVWTGPGGQNRCPFIISITVCLVIDQACMECLLLQDSRLGPKNTEANQVENTMIWLEYN